MKSFIKLLSIVICLTSCELITPTPKMFSCRVNGKLWEPYIKGTFGGRFTGNATYYSKQNNFTVYGSSEDCYIAMNIILPVNSSIELNKEYPIQLTRMPNYANGRFVITIGNSSKQDYLANAISGYFKITEMNSQYFSGTFEFDLEKQIESKTYKIRNGQFNNMLYVKENN